jgi:hypothetical protein
MIEHETGTDTTEVPEWSGRFEEVSSDVGLMRVHNNDFVQHFPPEEGWRPVGHNTFEDGSFETYIYFRSGPL